MGAGGGEPAAGGVDHAHGVLDGDELVAAVGAAVAFGAAEGGEDEGAAAGDAVRAVEFGGDLDGEAGAGEGGFGDGGVGGGGDEVAADGEEDFDPAVAQGADGFDGVEAVLAGRREAEFAFEGVEELRGGAFADAHGAVALDVAVAAYRADSGAGAADVAAQ